jgi:hypothetical protein
LSGNGGELKAPVECPNCGRLYRADKISRCPGCRSQAVENPSTPSTTDSGPQPINYEQESLARQAGNQAKVVDKFGEVLQVLGYFCITIFLIALTFSLFTKNWIAFGVFLVAVPLTFVYFNVFGSALRAVALYIQAKVK